jgi:hypothetical protein
MSAPSTGTPTANSKWRVDVDLDLANFTGNWAQLRGMSNFVPGKNDTVTDTTDYDTDGWGSDAVMQQKHANTCTVRRNKYAGSYDPAQEILRGAADAVNQLVHIRWYERVVGGEAYEGYALVQWAPQGGDAPGLSEVNVTFLGQSARVAIANPWSADQPPVINGVTPSTGDAAGGTNVIITGSGFAGITAASAVKFATNNATEYTVVSDSTIVAKTPAHTAGAVDVVVTNANGASTTGTNKFEYV